jgi:cytosine/adenosine deaminase-related metal-dependent hydrolase
MDILIENGILITMDKKRSIIRNGAIAVRDKDIVAIGKTEDLRKEYKNSKIIDATNKLVCPGFIDAHSHSSLYLAKGLVNDEWSSIYKLLYDFSYVWESALKADDVYIGALGLFLEMIKHGTTCFADPGGYHDHCDMIGEAMKRIGIRGVITRSTRDRTDPEHPIPEEMMESTEETLRKCEDIVRKWNGAADGRIKGWFSLRILNNVSDELCRLIKSKADEYGVGIHCHLHGSRPEELIKEGKLQQDETVKTFGISGVERLKKLGVLGPNLLGAHCPFTNEQERMWLRETNTKIVHCPTAQYAGGGGGIAMGTIPEIIKAGVTVALGHDAVMWSNFVDPIRLMYIAAAAHKDAKADVRVMGAHKAMEMATINGAKALRWEDKIGSLEVGKRADIVIIDTHRPEWQPCHPNYEITNLVYSASGDSVETVIIDGNIVMENRKVTTIDEYEILEDVRKHAFNVRERSGLKLLPPKWPEPLAFYWL